MGAVVLLQATTIGTETVIAVPSISQALAILLAIPIAQVTHELAHFVAAYLLRKNPILHIRLREKMAVSYDDSDHREAALIGLAPLLTGVGIGMFYVSVVGWPDPSWWFLAAAIGVVFHSLPSRQDMKPVGPLVGIHEPLPEWERSLLKGILAWLIASYIPLLPYYNGHVFYLMMVPLYAAGLGLVVIGASQCPDLFGNESEAL